MVNFVFSLTNLTYVFNLLKELSPMPILSIKLYTFLLYALIVIFVIEPEKLRWMTKITMLTFLFISKERFLKSNLSSSRILLRLDRSCI